MIFLEGKSIRYSSIYTKSKKWWHDKRKRKDGFLGGTILGPLKGYTTRNGITRSILDDMNLIGGN